MVQLSRLISLLTVLKSKRLITATELASKYDVSVRTIYRDIKKLEAAGIPVYSIEGKGYSLVENYTVSPVHFTEQQANALVTAAHIVNKSKDISFVTHFNEALVKIKSVFRTSIQEKSEALNSKLYVFDWPYEEFSSNALSEKQLAITNFNRVAITYEKVNSNEVSHRKIEPCAMYATNKKWILVAWCLLRSDYRAFRIDRIRHFKLLDETFVDRKFNMEAYFKSFY